MGNRLTQKELMYLNDVLGSEEKEIKKFNHACSQVQDPQAKSVLKSIATMHQSHFDTLKRHIDTSTMQ